MTPVGPSPPTITADVPETWSWEEHVGPYALVARAPSGSGFASNLTVAVAPYDPGLSPEQYLAAQVTDLTSTLIDVVVLHAEARRNPGRAFVIVAHDAGTADLTLVQNHRLLPDGLAVIATVTAADADWSHQVGDLLALATSVRSEVTAGENQIS